MHAYIHTSIHTYIHIYIHTYIHAYMMMWMSETEDNNDMFLIAGLSDLLVPGAVL